MFYVVRATLTMAVSRLLIILLILLNHFLELIQIQLVVRMQERKKRERQTQLDDIKDPDLKRELASGQTQLISYTEHHAQ